MITSERKQEIEMMLKSDSEKLMSIVKDLKASIHITCHYYDDNSVMSLVFFHPEKGGCDHSATPDGMNKLIDKFQLAAELTTEREMSIKSELAEIKQNIDDIANELQYTTAISVVYFPTKPAVFVDVLTENKISAHNVEQIPGMLKNFNPPERIEFTNE